MLALIFAGAGKCTTTGTGRLSLAFGSHTVRVLDLLRWLHRSKERRKIPFCRVLSREGLLVVEFCWTLLD